MSNEAIIQFKDFSFKYHTQKYPTLKNINLTIHKGEKVLIIGPSGSGKSTIGHCINGLIPFSYKGEITGSITVNGVETRDTDIFGLSKTVGTVLQDSDGQFVGLSVAEDIAFSLENDCIPLGDMKERVQKVAATMDILDLLEHSPHQLSGGQKQRTALAGIMVDDVDVLLFDEPLANLDPATGKYAIEIIDDIHKQSGKAVVIVEHRIEDVLYKDVDRIVLLSDGEIVADMNVHEMIASDLFEKHGIREPLYVTLLKHAGVEITKEMKPGYIDTINLENCKEIVDTWFKEHYRPEVEVEGDSQLKVEDLSFKYVQKKQVLKDIDFDIIEGEMVSIVGRNGAGKSTLSKLVCGFEKGYEGRILFQSEDIINQTITERAELVGYVMQNPNQMITTTLIYDEIALGLKLRDVPEEEIEPRVDKVLEICGLTRFKTWPISALSYGQRKRVTIASILVLDPKIIILDEPTAGQDYYHYTEIMEFLKEINKLGITIILITHDMHLMLEYTHRSIVLSEGELITDTTSSKVLTSPDIIEKANLKETSLFHLGNMLDIDPKMLVDTFISYEEEVRNRE
jgi:energy-coupling factor transport system ATP-binding protein